MTKSEIYSSPESEMVIMLLAVILWGNEARDATLDDSISDAEMVYAAVKKRSHEANV